MNLGEFKLTLNDMVGDILARIEENEESGPIFWSLIHEILPALVDGMFEASLITGVVQAINVPIYLSANTTYFRLQGQTSGYGEGGYGEGGYGGDYIGVPRGVLSVLRMRAPHAIRKCTLEGLSAIIPGWQAEPAAEQIISWFPLGVSMFGIYPQLKDDAEVLMDFLVSPVVESRPYDLDIAIPFQVEFMNAFSEYAAVMLRTKEQGSEAEEADAVFKQYLDKMKSLSIFQGRLDNLIMTGTYGARSTVSSREAV